MWFRWLVPVIIATTVACDAGPEPPDILDELAGLPGVTVREWIPPADFERAPGYRYFDLWFTQPVDHANPEAGSFLQYAALMHRDAGAPLVVYTSGYGAGWRHYLTEPAELVAGNQLSLEYRFYAHSKPEVVDWSRLDVHQAADDEHAILAELATLYTGNTIGTGGSKGGEHALQYARLYPEDMDGVVAYVAPVITDLFDTRYDGSLDALGIDACTSKLRALQRAMLERRAAMEQRAAAQGAFDFAGVAHATETGIVELEFSFWMTRGEPDCPLVPEVTVDDDTLFAFLDETSPPLAYGDAELLDSGQQYIYQDMTELGYPTLEHTHIDDLMQFSYEDWSAYLPPGAPVSYDPSAPRDLAAWTASEAEHILAIYGEWDPWSPGAIEVAAGHDSYKLWVPHGSHWSSGIYSLPDADATLAVSALRRWAGVAAKRERVSPRPPRASMATLGPKEP
jgi:PS-10 peptidase S37